MVIVKLLFHFYMYVYMLGIHLKTTFAFYRIKKIICPSIIHLQSLLWLKRVQIHVCVYACIQTVYTVTYIHPHILLLHNNHPWQYHQGQLKICHLTTTRLAKQYEYQSRIKRERFEVENLWIYVFVIHLFPSFPECHHLLTCQCRVGLDQKEYYILPKQYLIYCRNRF